MRNAIRSALQASLCMAMVAAAHAAMASPDFLVPAMQYGATDCGLRRGCW